MFLKGKQQGTYDKANKKPILHISICTGEKVAGFKDLKTGKFEDIMLIRNENDLELFLEQYKISPHELSKEY